MASIKPRPASRCWPVVGFEKALTCASDLGTRKEEQPALVEQLCCHGMLKPKAL